MTNCYCINLDLPVSIDYTLVDNFIPLVKDCSIVKLFEISINQELENYLLRYGVGITKAHLFYTPPNTTGQIHVDGEFLTDKCKLNYTYQGKGHRMLWWKVNHDNSFTIDDGTLYDGNPTLFFTHDNCTQLWADEVGQPGLVQIGIPHSLDSIDERWCFSYSLSDKITNQPLTWDVAIKRLKKFMRA
jgi:hypothetical protein